MHIALLWPLSTSLLLFPPGWLLKLPPHQSPSKEQKIQGPGEVEVNETENWKRCWRASEGNQGGKHGDHSSGSSLLSSSTIIFLTG